jgi:CheY-like chemotaxis protein
MTTPTDKHILIIEDEKPMAKALEIKLTLLGYKTTVVHNGFAGLEALEQANFDLILCDLIMPKMDGFGVLESLRAKNIPVPIIIMSNLSQEEDQARAMSLGARDFIVKSNTPIATIMDLVKNTLT